jgi:hypothetical protein
MDDACGIHAAGQAAARVHIAGYALRIRKLACSLRYGAMLMRTQRSIKRCLPRAAVQSAREGARYVANALARLDNNRVDSDDRDVPVRPAVLY